ncbi:MAG: sugar kinase [Fibrobacterota bacterium]
MAKPAYLREFDLTVLGEVFVEFLCEGIPLSRAETFERSIGGDAVYTAVTAARHNSRIQLISAVARDPYHTLIRSTLRDEGINTDLLRSVMGFNGITLVDDCEGSGDLREYQFNRPGTATEHINGSVIDTDIITNSRIIYSSGEFQAISRECRQTLFKAFYTAHTNECMVAFDPNIRLHRWSLDDAREAIWSIMPFLDVMLPSAPQESQALFGYERPVDIIGFLWDRGVNIAVVKNGKNGCLVGYDGRIEEYMLPEPSSPVRHFVHIGSVFNGAFLSALAKGMDPFEAARFAVKTATEKGMAGNGIKSIPSSS